MLHLSSEIYRLQELSPWDPHMTVVLTLLQGICLSFQNNFEPLRRVLVPRRPNSPVRATRNAASSAYRLRGVEPKKPSRSTGHEIRGYFNVPPPSPSSQNAERSYANIPSVLTEVVRRARKCLLGLLAVARPLVH